MSQNTRIRIVVLDHYMSHPISGLDPVYSESRSSPVNQVPVLRCFGITDNGKKICVHIHGAFPYLYVPYGGQEPPEELMCRLASALDKAINVSFNQSRSVGQHVYKISLVSGIPMYGYHARHHQFFKIFLYNPRLVTKVSRLLLNGQILEQQFQPYEAHLNFTLQFMIDYNLHGMSFMEVSEISFRTKSDEKTSICELEADIKSDSIINRIEGVMAVNPGLQALWEDEKHRNRMKDKSSQLGDFLKIEIFNGPPTSSHEIFKMALGERLKITLLDNSNTNDSQSVYPAETPKDSHLLDASLVAFHSTPSLDDTVQLENLTLTQDVTFDEDVCEFMRILEEMADEKAREEDDCILSQVTVDEEIQDDEPDLNMTLENDISIPQIDGNSDISTAKKPKCILRRAQHDIVEEIMRLARFRLKRLENRQRIEKMTEFAIKQESRLKQILQENTPRFKAVPYKRCRKKKPLKVNTILKSLAQLSENYISPDLEILVKTPLEKWLLQYDGRPHARVLKLLPSFVLRLKPQYELNMNMSQLQHQIFRLDRLNIPKCYKDLIIKVKRFDCTETDEENWLNNVNLKQKILNTTDCNKNVLENKEKICDKKSQRASNFTMTLRYDSNPLRILNCDGACDSSSDEEDAITSKLKTFKENPTKFTPLKITVTRSPRIPTDSGYGISMASTSHLDMQFNETKIEEFLSCTYSDKSSQKHELLQQSIQKKSPNYSVILKPRIEAPTIFQVMETISKYEIPQAQVQEPFYSNPEDYTGVVEVGHRVLRIPSKTTAHLQEFGSKFNGLREYREKIHGGYDKALDSLHCPNKSAIICPVEKPPSRYDIHSWLKSEKYLNEPPLLKSKPHKIYVPNLQGSDDEDLEASPCSLTPLSGYLGTLSGESTRSGLISGVSKNDTFGFDSSVRDLQAARSSPVYQYLTTMVLELHVCTRNNLKPDPKLDPICAIFYSIFNDVPEHDNRKLRGLIAVKPKGNLIMPYNTDQVNLVDNEETLIQASIELVKNYDPDILAGFEIEMLSWGYLVDRALILGVPLLDLLGRCPGTNKKAPPHDLETGIVGRVVLNVWRIMRHEASLQSYTLESVSYHLLHKRVPNYDFKTLTYWWESSLNVNRTIRYYLQRVDLQLELFDKLDFINRTSELARVFGIQFYEVLSRGSQFRVESMMLRLAKPQNYVPVSPDERQRAEMKAPEFLPLILEPDSRLYCDPVIVLDFQSLYPSIIIAYNYCFTTCLGRIKNLGSNQPFEFGATQLKVPKKLLEKLQARDLINYSPCGVAFVKQKVREGILPRMLKEVLDTRLMVKNSMKENKKDDNLQKVLHSRQLALKLIANVTYGYTAANFSGRMCCVEVGDSVVAKGRETLQRAIALVEENASRFEAKVVYGDTDSLFVLVPGKTIAQAFEVGRKIAEAVTNDNPDPVKLKLEKVYQPCILQTKKRYVGYLYENPEDKPEFEAKGIETVRRDGCPAGAKMLEKCLMLLFETKDVSLIKRYVLKQFTKILSGRISVQDLTFAKEFRGRSGYRPGACVPALELARKWTIMDPRNEPRSGERVPYVIVNGPPGLPLIRLVRSPKDLLADPSLRPNAVYYITKVIIPPINRCFNLIGADLNTWLNEMPRKTVHYFPTITTSPTKSTISQYFVSKVCAACGTSTGTTGLCEGCGKDVQSTTLILMDKVKKWEENYSNVMLICESCSGQSNMVDCVSLDCPVMYRKHQTFHDLQQGTYMRELLNKHLFSF
ncbi:hypothetical protein ABEB36_015394 [Hypothenemus hampei]|uniref:DNA polymerase n=1 Tax=Hypothenemus hampei TaxID=57062 RepID=A0ABD1E041_HYPHA